MLKHFNIFFYPLDKTQTGGLKFASEDQNQDKWNDFVSNYIIKCENPSSVAKNLTWLGSIREPNMTLQQINKVKKLLDIFHLEENPEQYEEIPIKSVDDILDTNQIATTNGIWTKIEDDSDYAFGQSDYKIGTNAKEDAPTWLNEVDEDIIALDWHFLMQKFKQF